MILDPINSVTSIAFYRKVSKQSLWRTLFYLPYLALILATAGTFAVKTRVMPVILESMDWLEKSVPAITYAGGKISTPTPGPFNLRHPSAPELGVIIDATRTDPVTPQMMEQSKAIVYLTNNAFYTMREPGRVEVFDLSKSASPKPLVIDSTFYRAAREGIGMIIYPTAFITSFLFFLAWKCATGLGYSLLALIFNAIAEGGLDYLPLFSIAIYAQTMAAALLAMYLFIWPLGIQFFQMVVLMTTGIYLWLAIKANAPPAQEPAP